MLFVFFMPCPGDAVMIAPIQEPRGLVHVYCGEGKGKTTAAIGLGMRASGRGKKVLLVRFLKTNDSGELVSIAQVKGFEILDREPVKGFVDRMTDEERAHTALAERHLFETAVDRVQNGGYSLLILDEAIGAMGYGMLPVCRVLEFLSQRPSGLEVVLTGRNPPQELLAVADYISEIKCVRHPFQCGIAARIGIER
jgi:cob(I)alamin adenosyltransferase